MTRFIKKRTDHVPDVREKVCSYKDCKGKVIGQSIVDIDVEGFYYCKKHGGEIGRAMLALILGLEELSKIYLGYESKKNTKSPPKSRKRHSKKQ